MTLLKNFSEFRRPLSHILTNETNDGSFTKRFSLQILPKPLDN